MNEIFPLTRKQIFKLPDLEVESGPQTETYKGLFLNELLALDLSAKRAIQPAGYLKFPDGRVNLNLQETVLDVSTFYLFAHKTLVSAIFILSRTLPASMRNDIPFSSYSKFMKKLLKQDNDVLKELYMDCGKELQWAQTAIIDKRDDLVQHWQGNASNKFFTSIYAIDLPLLIYYNPSLVEKIDTSRVDQTLARISAKIKKAIEPTAEAIHKIAWMEAWAPRLSHQLQEEIESLLDNETFIALPVTPQLVHKLDGTISSLIKSGLNIRNR